MRVCVQRGQQHRLAGQAGPLGDVGIVEVEGLVGDADDGAAAGADVPAAADAEVVQRGRGVERLGRRGAPVDQQRLLAAVLGLQPDPADVARDVGVAAVEPAEAEPALGGVEGDQPLGVELHGRLALADGLRVVRDAGQGVVEAADHLRADVVEPPVQAGHVALLGGQLLVVVGSGSC